MMASNFSELCALPIQHRLELVESLWDSIAQESSAVALPEWHKAILDERLQNAEDIENIEGVSWSSLKTRLLVK
jgi:putative addiction module component (TIGR02574 family)